MRRLALRTATQTQGRSEASVMQRVYTRILRPVQRCCEPERRLGDPHAIYSFGLARFSGPQGPIEPPDRPRPPVRTRLQARPRSLRPAAAARAVAALRVRAWRGLGFGRPARI